MGVSVPIHWLELPKVATDSGSNAVTAHVLRVDEPQGLSVAGRPLALADYTAEEMDLLLHSGPR